MEHRMTTGPKDFFLWVAATAALYVSVISLLALWFELIDRIAGEPVYDLYSAGIRMGVASLVVIFPLYVYFMRKLHTDIREHREKKELWVRRWLLVLTLFIAGLTMVVDLIVLINAFLGGEELTLQFTLKVLAVLIVAGGAFLYYLHEARGTWERKERESVWIAAVVGLVVFASIVTAFVYMGSPSTQRKVRNDQERVTNLQDIQWQVTDYWQQKERLPENLDDLKDPLRGAVIPEDPKSDDGYAYEYQPKGVTPKKVAVFELCATFETSTLDQADAPRPGSVYYPESVESEYWRHDAGRVCFERTIDPEKFPPYSKSR